MFDWVSKNAYEGKRFGLQWTYKDLDYAGRRRSHRLADMKMKGERLQETGGQIELKIIIQKTKEMRIGVRQQESLELHGGAVKRVSEFRHLGSIISETGVMMKT